MKGGIRNDFPGYKFVEGKNMYRGTDLGKGGYVYAEPGMYGNVALLDIASMHPNSIINLNAFGEYTERFKQIVETRLDIKNGKIDAAMKLFDGVLAKYLEGEASEEDLAYALKIAINSVYGLTSANFDNPFRDIRNKNNIVALRGALFMRTLQDEVVKRGFQVAHIKTDSIKIPDATTEIIDFCFEFAKIYGYTFEHEATYDRMCLVNDAVYIAKYKSKEECEEIYGYIPKDNKKKSEKWTATGTQFQVPYVFKKLFSKEEIEFDDMCETKSVTSSLYLDMNEGYPDVTKQEKELATILKTSKEEPHDEDICMIKELEEQIAQGHNYQFIGKVGRFCPIKSGCGGGLLMREKDGKYYSATGAKGYHWLESETVRSLGREQDIDESFYIAMTDAAIDTIKKFGDYEWFVSKDPYIPPMYYEGKYGLVPGIRDEDFPF